MASKSPSDKYKSILLIIFGAAGILGLLIRGVYILITGIDSFVSASSTANEDLASGVLNMVAMLFCSLLLIPIIYYSARRLNALEIHTGGIRPVKIWQAAILTVVWFFVVLTAGVLAARFQFGWIAAIPLFPFGLALPIITLAWIGAGGIPTGSRRRLWSVFGVGLAGSSLAAVVGEYLVVGIGLVIFGAVALAYPELRTLLQQLKDQLANAQDMEAALNVLAPYLTNPLVFAVLLGFVAGIGPLIEEAVKPVVIWFVGKRLRSPAEGFALGALCGAGFALLEGLMATSSASQAWGFGMAGRAASSLMHITASGIMGWGIASLLVEKRFGRLVAAYLASVSIHSLWNGSVLLTVFGALRVSLTGGQPDLVSALIMLVGAGALLILFPLILVLLPVLNRILRPAAPVLPETAVQNDV